MRRPKNTVVHRLPVSALFYFLFIFILGGQAIVNAQSTKSQPYTTYHGKIYDAKTNDALSGVHLTITSTNMGSVSNKDGEFTLKVPTRESQAVVKFSKVGYREKNIQLTYFDKKLTEVYLTPSQTTLRPVELYTVAQPKMLVKSALEKRKKRKGYLTAFYREKINRGHQNVMLGEAVVQIAKNKWEAGSKGEIKVYKARKRADYERLDTIAIKFRGGPYSMLYMDVVHYPEYLFRKENLDAFKFNLKKSIKVKNRLIHVIHFEQIDKREPWYFGNLFIEAKTNALVKADYHLNVDNQAAARRFLVVQKPGYSTVTPLETHYEVEYVHQNGEWKYSYSHFYINLRVNWKKKLFNKRYSINSEMVITNRHTKPPFNQKDLHKISPKFVMANDISGFKKSDFWGDQNIIPPEESLREAIQTIKQKIEKP